MSKQTRDDFTEKTKRQIAGRAGWRCSAPSCRRPTIGSTSDGDGEIMVGVAAHICAAAPGGPRYDASMSRDERSSVSNGIWMCQVHAKAIDSPDSTFTVEQLRTWKADAQKESWRDVLGYSAQQEGTGDGAAGLAARLAAAAKADLDAFRQSEKWATTAVALTVKVEGFDEPVSTAVLGDALARLGDLVLVAPPGMGKTTTLFQAADSILTHKAGSPIIIPLGEWATEKGSLLGSVIKRPAYQGLTESDLRAVAAHPGVFLLLDGWNELDDAARKLATAQVQRLQRELPSLNLMIATRQQAMGVPGDGARVSLQPLSEKEQLDIAKVRSDGERLLDQAWRTPGVRDLVQIPLYLTALLELPEGEPFPTTKEEVLRRFVGAHEGASLRALALAEVLHGLQANYLEGLAVVGMQAGTTTITDRAARKSVSETAAALAADGQISEKPEPDNVLEVLVAHHVLTRSGAGYAFQHQQFQEWYASHFIERLMMEAVGDAAARQRLMAEILDLALWEEAVLFACERLSRGETRQQEACGEAILAAFTVDPLFAAAIIARATEGVWTRVGEEIQRRVRRWHTPGKVDRAFRFMLRSGRPDFLREVWPLITHADRQTRLSALHAGGRLRASILGSDPEKRLRELPTDVRDNILHELAMSGRVDALDLATRVAKDDPEASVKGSVVEALGFRKAVRHAVDVLRHADDTVFDRVVKHDLIDEVDDAEVGARLEAARERRRKVAGPYDRLHALVCGPGGDDADKELAALIGELEPAKDGLVHLVYEAYRRKPRAVIEGLLTRVRTGRSLFHGVDDLLAAEGVVIEDVVLETIALSDLNGRASRGEAAASVLGPRGVSRLLDALLEAKTQVRNANGERDKAADDHYHALKTRIAHAPGASLAVAVRARSAGAANAEMKTLADLIAHRREDEGERSRPFDEASRDVIRDLAEEWGYRLLASADATRSQLASIAGLARVARWVTLLPLLKKLLDEELRRYRIFWAQAKTERWRHGKAKQEAQNRSPQHEYYQAFDAIKSPETAALMREYLADDLFGQYAADVLAGQWRAVNEPPDGKRLWPDWPHDAFARVAAKRAARAADPNATCEEAEAIFAAIEPLIGDDATEEQKRLALELGIVAVRLPHGERHATLRKLITLAKRETRVDLLMGLALSGETIAFDDVKEGIDAFFVAAKTESWRLHDEAWELKKWLRLLPFTDRPAGAFGVLRGLPDRQRDPHVLENVLTEFGSAPGEEVEQVLFQLAEADSRFYASYAWRAAVFGRGTASAARRIVELAASGVFGGRSSDRLAGQIGGLFREHPELRRLVYNLLERGVTSAGLELLAEAVAENPDTDGLVLLIKIEEKRSLLSWHTLEKLVTEHIPLGDGSSVYQVEPAPAPELRRRLLAMTTDGSASDAAARCLTAIDKIRDSYGKPDSEPRHPDLASGKPWPILAPDPAADEVE